MALALVMAGAGWPNYYGQLAQNSPPPPAVAAVNNDFWNRRGPAI